MPARPSSSLGFNRNVPVSFPGSSSEQARRRADSSGVVPSGTALAAELYASLLPLDDHPDLSIPPPPYELIDPISTALNPEPSHMIPMSDHGNRINNRTDGSAQSASDSRSSFSRSTQSAPASGTNISPVQVREIPSGGIDGTPHDHQQRALRERRPPSTNRSRRSEPPPVSAASFRSQSESGRDRRQSQLPKLPVDRDHQHTRKLAKLRPLPANVIHQDKVNQVYQPVTVYHPLSPPQTPAESNRPPLSPVSNRPPVSPVSNRPPLSNASRANRDRQQSCGLRRSNHIRATLINGSSTTIPHTNTTAEHRGRTRERDSAGVEPALPTTLTDELGQVGRPVPPIETRPVTHTLSSSSQEEGSGTHWICPHCRFIFFDQHLRNLHQILGHCIPLITANTSTDNINVHTFGHPTPPPVRPPPPLPCSIHQRPLLVDSARLTYLFNHFT
ncbi:hypothetical protein PGTUg99_024401 [Puccinia graminis f. sp. tritici]|uniref:Uncharacterized protein n=1 Tax=Puccinia graminis f. sp. tritici TaxID=56615 RepID=A0A5B0PLW7_PUCGR|nr:hypothetical protein PGTUg99_024401 [Puccinia graminis f. sp. tritici]